MPEGDTVYLAAKNLHLALAGAAAHRLRHPGAAPMRPSTSPAARRRGGQPGQAPADPGRRPDHPHPPEDGRLLAALPRRRQLAAPAVAGAHHPQHTRSGSPSAFSSASSRSCPATAEADASSGTLGPGPARRRTGMPDEALRRLLADPDRAGRRGHPGPAQHRRTRQCLPERAVLPARRAADPAGGRGHRTGEARRPGAPPARREQEPHRAHDHRQTARRNHWVYGRDGKPCYRCGTAILRGVLGDPPRDVLLVPALPELTGLRRIAPGRLIDPAVRVA